MSRKKKYQKSNAVQFKISCFGVNIPFQLWSHVITGYSSTESIWRRRDCKDIFLTAQGLPVLLKQRYVWLLCQKINIRFPSAFFSQPPGVLISICKLILSCVQPKHRPYVCAYLKVSSLLYHLFFLFLSVGECRALPCGLFWEPRYTMDPYLVRKFTLPLPTKITPVCWCDNLGKQDHTRQGGQTGATAPLPIPHFTLMSSCI